MMNRSLTRISALLVFSCSVGLAMAQSSVNPNDSEKSPETQRLASYAKDVLSNKHKECSVLRNAREEKGGRVIAECLSDNKMRELTYSIDPVRGNREARVALVSNQHNREMKYREVSYLDSL
jgi:hypothetical protein